MVKKKQWMVFLLSFSLLCGMMPVKEVSAKKTSLNTKKLTITIGKSKTLKIKNTKKKVTWKILSGKKYITIKKKGKMSVTVKGRKTGTAKVQAKVGKKKLICRVTVKSSKKTVAAQKPKHTARPVTTDSTKPTPSSMPTVTTPPAGILIPVTNPPGATHIPVTNPPGTTEEPDETNPPTDSEEPVLNWDRLVRYGDISVKDGVLTTGEYSGYNSYDCRGTLRIPDTAGVTAIGENAFEHWWGLTEITIPNSVTTIGSNAFWDCGLTKITIPSSLTYIEGGIFADCSSLASIRVDSGNAVYDSRNDCNAIIETETNTLVTGCQNTTIPASITSIGRWAFTECSSLTEITIPASVTSIGESPYGENPFYGCSSLTSIRVEAGNTVYDSRDNCNAIIETEENALIAGCQNTTIPTSVTIIGYEAFRGCSSLTEIAIPNGVTTIEYSAFHGCSSLMGITIPDSVSTIEMGAFWSCSSLTEITIPANVTTIEYGTFYNCSSLTAVTIPPSVTTIGQMAFDRCSSLTKITIPNGVTKIWENAFANCSNLTEITIPNSVTTINSYAFADCSSLTEIAIPDSVTYIGNYAFKDIPKVHYSGTAAGAPWGAWEVVPQ